MPAEHPGVSSLFFCYFYKIVILRCCNNSSHCDALCVMIRIILFFFFFFTVHFLIVNTTLSFLLDDWRSEEMKQSKKLRFQGKRESLGRGKGVGREHVGEGQWYSVLRMEIDV
ncbi:hypothetical protein Cni_G08207 [Canna indica]|uniref:Uncharacterized protein n=1 Tax=Canna indica TaxID=4628 RepID=A0AAQ3Q5I3_9LILI|nr:hypothetical protein Cni_G08207 [Canna indica]